ncbi:Uncharacterised protein [Flavonifractor plautii]|nr:Uncharacterised protein [Flavonifractor plautii]CUQ61302.1 Uncharacterised protein [Flavonifractor plautii]
MRQTRAFCKLILRPAPLLSICGYGRENIFHLHHPFACVLRKLYFCLSLLFNNFNRIILTIYTSKRRMISVSQKSCFFIGHRETPEEIYPVLCAAVEEHIVRYGVTEFIVGRYGCFDGLAAKAVKTAKQTHPEVELTLLLPYHPAERPIPVPDGFDSTYYPPGMENVPRKVAIVRANRYMVDHTDFLIAYAWHPASNARDLLEYARKREGKGLIHVTALPHNDL